MEIINYKNKYYLKTEMRYREILSSTDISLGLPQPSKSFIQAFIEAYNEGKPITKVLVEYDAITLNEDWSKRPVVVTNEYKLKVNFSNEITIKKVKDSWTREEFMNALHKVELNHNKDYSKLWNEIKENL